MISGASRSRDSPESAALSGESRFTLPYLFLHPRSRFECVIKQVPAHAGIQEEAAKLVGVGFRKR
jgi:hypothetical protein